MLRNKQYFLVIKNSWLDCSVQVRIPHWNSTSSLSKCGWLLLLALWCFSSPAICAGIIYIKLEHLGLFPACKLAQTSFGMLSPPGGFYWDLFPLISLVKMLAVCFPLSLGLFFPFHVPSAVLIIWVFHICVFFFPKMPLCCTYFLPILKTPLWLQLFL